MARQPAARQPRSKVGKLLAALADATNMCKQRTRTGGRCTKQARHRGECT